MTTEDDSTSSISGILSYCKRRILYPYLRLLGVMGLKPLTLREAGDPCTCAILVNKLYIVLVTLLLFSGYALQYLTCFRRDRGFAFKDLEAAQRHKNDDFTSWYTMCRGNAVYSHIFPTLLHLSSFFYMVYLYRLNEDEQLPNLLERVFLQAAHPHNNLFSQRKLLKNLQIFVAFSIAWLTLSCASIVVQITTHSSVVHYMVTNRTDFQDSLLGFMTFSTVWQDGIQVTIIVSYCIHCYLLSTYLNLIHARIQQHLISIQECVKEIGEFEKLLKYLNGDLAPGVGPILVMDSTFAISGLSFLINSGTHLKLWDLVCVAVMSSLWIILFIVPIVQAAKLAQACKRFREVGHLVRMRPFGFQDTRQADLDSFLLFVSSFQMNVNILRIPISISALSTITGVLVFGFLMWGLLFV